MPPAPIRAEALRKIYTSRRGTVRAVDGIDLEIGAGEFFGLLGPNGAGKSTTIGMLTTRILPSSGRAEVGGHDVVRESSRVRRRIGVVQSSNTLDRRLTVAENLEYHARYFGVGFREARRRTTEQLERFTLADRAKARVHELSTGQAQRVMIARALMHEPDLLFLDEPTSGIDPQTRVNIWVQLRALHDAGQTMLLTTHNMEEADALCDRLAIIDHGQVLALDTPDALKRDEGAESVVTVVYDGDAGELAGAARGLRGVTTVDQDGAQLRVRTTEPAGLVGSLVTIGSERDRSVVDASSLLPSLESVFLNLTGREYRE